MSVELISIIVPFKNTSDFLRECIISVQNQSEENWEMIMVNDHSTDNSADIARQFAVKDSRIRVYTNEGEGIIPALQTAYRQSKGNYITRMDSDDRMHPLKLQRLLEGLQNYGKGHIAVGQVKYFSEDGISEGYRNYEAWINGLTATGNNFTELYKECVIPSPCWMLSRTDFEACGGFNSSRYPEDYDLTFRMYEQQYTCIPCTDVLHYWRDYPTRTSRTHVHYAQNYFLDIKMHYFLKLNHDKNRPLVVWGAGFKGKTVAKALIQANVKFHWICNNPNKIKKHIYGQPMLPLQFLESLKNPQSIITVANPSSQKRIWSYVKARNWESMNDFFFFC